MARAFRTDSDADKHAKDRAEATARVEFGRFERTVLRSFGTEVAAWRVAVIRELKIEGQPIPRWLGGLG